METQNVNFSRIFNSGWEKFKYNAALAIVSYLIIYALAYIASNLFCIGWIAWFLILQFPFFGGITILFLKMIRDRGPDINDLFAGFKEFGKWLAIGWIFILIYFLTAFPLIFAAIVAGLILNPIRQMAATEIASGAILAGMIALIVFGALITLIIFLVVSVRYMFVFYLAADGVSSLESFNQSAKMTKGRFLILFPIFLILHIFGWIGMLFFCIGQIVTVPIASLGFASLYDDLKHIDYGERPLA